MSEHPFTVNFPKTGRIADLEAEVVRLRQEHDRTKRERDALIQYVTAYGSPQDWNRIRRLYPDLPERLEEVE
jgi:hypothetical protein